MSVEDALNLHAVCRVGHIPEGQACMFATQEEMVADRFPTDWVMKR